MLTFFRTNSLLQFILACLLFLTVRFVLRNNSVPDLIPELRWFLVAEGMSNSKLLYKNLIVGIDPLYAFFYRFFYSFFSRKEYAYEVIASFLIIFQSWYFSRIVSKRYLLKESSFLPAFLFLLCMSLSFDQIKFSPGLVANLFLLLGFNSLIRQFEFSNITDAVFEVGLFIGIAFICQFSCIFFLAWAILVAFFYTSISIRQVFLILFGFAIPFLFVFFYFYFNDGVDEFKQDWILNNYRFVIPSIEDISGLAYAFLITFILGIFGFLKLVRSNRFSNYQNKIHQVLFFQLMFAIPASLTNYFIAPSEVTFIVPSLAFFVCAYFTRSSGKWYSEIIFLLYVVVSIFLFFGSTKSNVIGNYTHLSQIRINKNEVKEKFKNQPIFVTGNHLSYYQNSKLATAYIDWNLSANDFEELNNYESLLRIYTRLTSNPPKYIVDEANVMKKVFERLPDFGKQYSEVDKNEYQLN